MLFSSRAWSEGESLKHFPSLMFFSPCHGLDMLEGPRIFRSTCIFCCPSFDSHIPSFNMKLPTFRNHWFHVYNTVLWFEIPKSLVTFLPFPFRQISKIASSNLSNLDPSEYTYIYIYVYIYIYIIGNNSKKISARCQDWTVKTKQTVRSSWPATHQWKPKRPRQRLLLGPFEASKTKTGFAFRQECITRFFPAVCHFVRFCNFGLSAKNS